MIRRDARLPDGRAGWLLISQVEHARLAGELASHWGAGGVAPLAPRDEVLPAIYHHDNGWVDWEKMPDVDPASGRPLAFTEMPQPAALAIWSGSIGAAAAIGPLAAWMVAGHFAALLRGSQLAETPAAQAWLADNDAHRAAWLAAWQAAEPACHTTAVATRSLAQLQLFDSLSLWLCCAQRAEPQSFATPDGLTVTFTPRAPNAIAVAPWPLEVDDLELRISGELVPVDQYASAKALAAAPRQELSVAWTIAPNA